MSESERTHKEMDYIFVNVDDVIVGNRVRTDLGDIDELAESLQMKGQLQPIVVTQSNQLVAGGRRLEAAKKLGWKQINAVLWEHLEPDMLRDLELEENLRRKDMSWQEVVRGRGELYDLRHERLGDSRGRGATRIGYGYRDFAKDIGVLSHGSLVLDLQLYRMMKEFPEADLWRFATRDMAVKAMNLAKERLLLQELAKREQAEGYVLTEQIGGVGPTEMADGTTLDERMDADDPGTPEIPEWHFFNTDCVELLKRLPDASIDLIVTDPPWGLGAGLRRLSWPKSEFDDSAAEVVRLRMDVLPELWRVLREDAHLYIFMGLDARARIMQALFELGFDVQTMPLIWIKAGGSSADLSVPCFLPNYETIIFAQKGSRALNAYAKMTFDVTGVYHETRIHTAEKPVELLMQLIELSSVEGEIVLDPYAGSASTLAAAIMTRRRSIGCEIMPEVYTKARLRLEQVRPRVRTVEEVTEEVEMDEDL